MKTTPAFSAALAFASSPSGWANFCRAVGEIPIGMLRSHPKILVDISIFETSWRHLGRRRSLGEDESEAVIFSTSEARNLLTSCSTRYSSRVSSSDQLHSGSSLVAKALEPLRPFPRNPSGKPGPWWSDAKFGAFSEEVNGLVIITAHLSSPFICLSLEEERYCLLMISPE